eukprot:TRINITY_DN9738_c0_g2_i1.p1 TRINITY_DN9738_c0_g2~~TRINITY_DN9738_c0_g2_i1.p1  ORF type:complete len:465 (+),score=209.03 TRINITY_DN9738_c0_g2_i1:68-1396(+)
MAFCVCVGTDLFGRKRNVKLEFPRCPTMSEFINAVESQYDVEVRASRPAGYPDVPFKVQTFQLYDDVLQRWVDLYSSAQLTNSCTVYCFQPESIWHSDAQGIIPDAQDTLTWTTPVGSPRRARIASDAGVAPTLSEKLRSVFYECDTGNKGYVLYSDLRGAFAKCDIEFTYATVGELFTAADMNKSGHITYDEWVAFSIKFPQIVDALFFRSRDVRVDMHQQAAVAAADDHARAARQEELRQMYERQQWQPPAASPAVQDLETQLQGQRAVAMAAATRQSELQQAAEKQAAAAAAAAQRLAELEAEMGRQQEICSSMNASADDARSQLEEQRRAAAAEAQREAEMHAKVEVLKRQEAEIEARRHAAEEAARQAAIAEAQERAAAEAEAAAAARAQADYETARREADAARIQKELAESRERQAWDKMYYSPQSPHYGASPPRN